MSEPVVVPESAVAWDVSPACVFCAIIADKAPATGLRYWGRGVSSFRPLRPVVPGHVLFVHEIHTETAGELPYITGIVVEAAAEYAKHQDSDYNLINSNGPNATQTVWHLHVHYVPRRDGDGLALPWTGQAR